MTDIKNPWWKRVLSWPWKAWVWLRTRRGAARVARTIASNQIAVAALAASVAAAGIGGYATYETAATNHKVDAIDAAQKALQQRLTALEVDQRSAIVALAELQYSVEVLGSKTAQDSKNTERALTKLTDRIQAVEADVKALPTVPDSSQAIAKARDLAVKAQATAIAAAAAAQKAQDAAQKAAANTDDPKAQADAAEALRAAQSAQQAAQLAASTANAAQGAADAAKAKIDALPTGYQPYPRSVEYGDIVTPRSAGAVTKSFTVDLDHGDYIATLHVSSETADQWTANISSAGRTTQKVTKTGPASVDISMVFSTGGGTNSFSVVVDGLTPGEGNITFNDVSVTFMKDTP